MDTGYVDSIELRKDMLQQVLVDKAEERDPRPVVVLLRHQSRQHHRCLKTAVSVKAGIS